MIAIVTYHYVRDLPRTRYPAIKGLLTSELDAQLDYIAARYTVCRLADFRAALRGEYSLPENACLLTFDDGFADHYDTVLPRLLRRGMAGSFFVPARPVLKDVVLDVHKIQFLLAAVSDLDLLKETIGTRLAEYRDEYPVPSDQELWAAHARAGRYDLPAVMFVKALLQHALPEGVRARLVNDLFTQYVTRDEPTFARELYLDLRRIRELVEAGMEIGGHGYEHVCFGGADIEAQRREIDGTVRFLCACSMAKRSSGSPNLNGWAMCYPYGSYDATTLALLRHAGCSIGLTLRVGHVNDLSRPLELPRLNTNDLPPRGSDVQEWYGDS